MTARFAGGPRVIANKKARRGLATSAGFCFDCLVFETTGLCGKMGFALAKECMLRGAEVTIVKAATTAELPMFVNVVPVASAADMFEAVTSRADQQDIIIKAAAVSDYT